MARPKGFKGINEHNVCIKVRLTMDELILLKSLAMSTKLNNMSKVIRGLLQAVTKKELMDN